MGVQKIGQTLLNRFSSGLTRIPDALPHLVNGRKASLTILYVGNSGIINQPVKSEIFNAVSPEGLPDKEVRLLRGLQTMVAENNPPPIITQIPAGPFTVCSNRVRALRDTRVSLAEDVPLLKPFDTASSFLQTHPAEQFHELWFKNIDFRFLYNLFPFAPYHFILIPNWKEHVPQFIDPANSHHRSIISASWELLHEMSKEGLPFRMGYNALGGHASRNQLHFQGFLSDSALNIPFEKDARLIAEGAPRTIDDFIWIPAHDSRRYAATDHLINWISVMHILHSEAIDQGASDDRVSYNFYMIPGRGIAFFPRKHQGNHIYVASMAAEPFQEAPLTTGLAFFEYLRTIVCPHESAYRKLEDMVENARALAIQHVFDAARLSPLPDRAQQLLN